MCSPQLLEWAERVKFEIGRYFFRFGLVRPAVLRMLTNVLAAGHSVPGSSFSKHSMRGGI